MTQTNRTPIQQPLAPPLADGPTEAQPADAAILFLSPHTWQSPILFLPSLHVPAELPLPAELPPGRGRGWGLSDGKERYA